ncbi:SIR2 family NAD-dependent protein deacylase [Actinomycetospora cinnamomea]|uniref:SIR2-like protein n=1 Tax=Actinomycetospora cinnamomea TaxID=663609 RepID=A0A2U1EB00_9PSEU|nr:SIR2 family protein [Actinomycetospora cinnamomea]PVY97087.1 SIR2-like protein [Actinomycetospora cinnamomea]
MQPGDHVHRGPFPDPRRGGHVFAVHGRIELLRHEAAVVPTGPEFGFSPTWRAVLGGDVEQHRPAGWGRDGVRHGRGGERVWFLDVSRPPGARLDWLLDGVRAVLADIAGSVRPAPERLLPLVLLPVVGIGAGGFGDDRGAVIRGLLDVADEVVAASNVDIAFVTPDAAVHGAVQSLRRRRRRWPLHEELLVRAESLAARARRGELALFFGAGVSIPAGLPGWPQLLRACLEACPELSDDSFHGLHPLDQGELLRRVLGDRFGRIVAERSTASRHALGHALLASLGCGEAATTNYDQCFEMAAAAADSPPLVMPWQRPRGGRPWLLKLNGDVGHPESIVLARRDFVRHETLARPMASVLESMMLTRHLLIVGASLTDDNVLRLAHEVADVRPQEGDEPEPFGTVLDVEAPGVRRRLWQGELDWVSLPGDHLAQRARALDVFLDAVAAHTTTDSSWVLDARFEALLADGDTEVARRAVALREALPDRTPWQGLRAELDRHGARGEPTPSCARDREGGWL